MDTWCCPAAFTSLTNPIYQRDQTHGATRRQLLDWKGVDFYNHESLSGELERFYDLYYGCRRCNSLFAAFPTRFDLVDESSTMEVDGVDMSDYRKVANRPAYSHRSGPLPDNMFSSRLRTLRADADGRARRGMRR